VFAASATQIQFPFHDTLFPSQGILPDFGDREKEENALACHDLPATSSRILSGLVQTVVKIFAKSGGFFHLVILRCVQATKRTLLFQE
jgi:hypothetical protein